MKRIIAGAAAALALTAGLATPAQAGVSWWWVAPVKANGPGLRNWHCVDTRENWWGPWRYTKSGAQLDCYDWIGSGQA